jgi:hypothetical protein
MKLEEYLKFDQEIKEKLKVWVNNRFKAGAETITSYYFKNDMVYITWPVWTFCSEQMPMEYLSLELEEIASKAAALYKENSSKQNEFVKLKREIENSEDFIKLGKLGKEVGKVPYLTEGVCI